jgi:glucose-1-phosphate adenylyltransferase
MPNKRLLILAGGMSSRMKKELKNDNSLDARLIEQANTLPKGMIGLGRNGRPFLDYLVYNAAQAGVEEVLLLLNQKDTVTQPHYENLQREGKTWGVKMLFARQIIPEGREKPLGTADAVWQALAQHYPWQTSRFVVCNSDNLYPVAVLKRLLEDVHPNALPEFDSRPYTEAQVRNCAIILKDKAGFLTDLIEKPDDKEWNALVQTQPKIGVSWNIFAFQGEELLPFLEKTPLSARNEKELPETVRLMAEEKDIFCLPATEVFQTSPAKPTLPEFRRF